MRKYAGLCWKDSENDNCLLTSHPTKMYYEKKKGNNSYNIVATKTEFYFTKGKLDNSDEKWEPWQFSSDFYDSVVLYYAENYDKYIRVYEKGGNADSESENEE